VDYYLSSDIIYVFKDFIVISKWGKLNPSIAIMQEEPVPLPFADHLIFLNPPVCCIISPAKGFSAN